MNTLTVLLLVLLVLMLLVGGRSGLRSFASVVVNTCLIILVALLISWGVNVIVCAVIFIPLKLLTIIYLGTHDLAVAREAFWSALAVSLVVSCGIIILQWLAQAHGLGDQSGEELVGLSLLVGISYPQICTLVAIFSTLGAIAEASVAMCAGLFALEKKQSKISWQSLVASGRAIGQDVLGTAVNTILFGFFGSCLPLLIWYQRLHYSLAQLVNDKLFVINFLMVIYSLLGVLLIVPLTTWTLAGKRKEHKK